MKCNDILNKFINQNMDGFMDWNIDEKTNSCMNEHINQLKNRCVIPGMIGSITRMRHVYMFSWLYGRLRRRMIEKDDAGSETSMYKSMCAGMSRYINV